MSSPKPSLDDLRIERRRPAGPGNWPWAALALLLLLAVCGLVWWESRGGAQLVRVAVARALTSDKAPRTVLNASGYVTARRAATVSSKVTGKVVEVLIEEGIKVQEGQVLARLDDTNVRAGLRLAEAQLESAKRALAETQVRIKEADLELQRQTGLLKNNISAQAEYDRSEAAALALKARLEQQKSDITVAERQVATWQQQLEDTIIRAPFAGIVTVKNAQPGEMISPISAGGGFTRTGICTIVDMQSLEVEIDVGESYINRVEAGQPVEATLDAYPEWKIPCKVIAIIPTADRQKSTVKVRVGFEKLDPRVLPEMSIKVAFHAGGISETGQPGLAATIGVPKTAVVQENDRAHVFILQNDRAERRAVNLTGFFGDDAALAAGVAPGEKVIVDPGKNLTDQVRVKVRQ